MEGLNMDTLEFRKRISKTDPELVGEEAEYVLAEILINSRPLLDIMDEYASDPKRRKGQDMEFLLAVYDYNDPAELYRQLTNDPTVLDFDGWPGTNNALLLVCGECFDPEDCPFITVFTETDNQVIWSNFRNDRTSHDYKDFPAFRFDKEQYESALEQLKVLAEESGLDMTRDNRNTTMYLCREETEDVKCHIEARFESGCLAITGQETGKSVSDVFGVDEYEYFYSFDIESTSRLLSLIVTDKTSLSDEFISRFGGMEGCKALREFCESNGITYQFSNYY
jgi:hypothetical protein